MRFAVLAVVATFGFVSAADAAVAVLGNRLAYSCYHAAEFGLAARDGEQTCTSALNNEALSVHDRVATFINRGVLRSNLHRNAEALADYDFAISHARYLEDPDLGVAYVDRSAVLNAMGRFDEALESVNKGLNLKTRLPEIGYYNRAVAYEGLGDVRRAYYDYKQALALKPGFGEAVEQLKRFRVIPAGGS